jgi:hypothetical protein
MAWVLISGIGSAIMALFWPRSLKGSSSALASLAMSARM